MPHLEQRNFGRVVTWQVLGPRPETPLLDQWYKNYTKLKKKTANGESFELVRDVYVDSTERLDAKAVARKVLSRKFSVFSLSDWMYNRALNSELNALERWEAKGGL